MTGCCCERAVHTHANPRTAAQSVITPGDICTNRQTSQCFIRTRSASFSLCPSLSLRCFRTSPRVKTAAVLSHEHVCGPADPGRPVENGPKVKKTLTAIIRAGISHDNSLSQTPPRKRASRLSGLVIINGTSGDLRHRFGFSTLNFPSKFKDTSLTML